MRVLLLALLSVLSCAAAGEDRLMDHAGMARAHVVGYSLGGIILIKLLTPRRAIEAGIYRALVESTAPTDALARARGRSGAGAAHPAVHERGLPRHAEFLAAIRRHIAARR